MQQLYLFTLGYKALSKIVKNNKTCYNMAMKSEKQACFDEDKVLGSIETVSFPEFAAIGKIQAKIDTGAHTGALHCTEVYLKKVKGKDMLFFSPFDHPEISINTRIFKKGKVRSSNGEEEERYFISTRIKIAGEIYPITLTLADRTVMQWDILIGKRFLSENNFIVDVNKGKS